MSWNDTAPFSELTGKSIISIEGAVKGSQEVWITCSDLTQYVLRHHRDCCEYVRVEDVAGDPADLVGQQVMLAEEVSNRDDPPQDADSFTWTFYKLRTHGGDLTIRWLGESNGYYSEGVDVERVLAPLASLTPSQQVLRDSLLERGL